MDKNNVYFVQYNNHYLMDKNVYNVNLVHSGIYLH